MDDAMRRGMMRRTAMLRDLMKRDATRCDPVRPGAPSRGTTRHDAWRDIHLTMSR
jgi:hypothetical protein